MVKVEVYSLPVPETAGKPKLQVSWTANFPNLKMIWPHEINCVFGVSCGSNDGSGGRAVGSTSFFFFLLQPTGGDPGVNHNFFWQFVFLWANLALLKPLKSVPWRGCVVQATKKKEEKLPLSCCHWVPLVRLLSELAKDWHVGKIQLKQVNHKLRRFRQASSNPAKSLVQHGFVEKKKKGKLRVYSRKLLLRGYKLKKPNTKDLERDLQRPRLRRSTIDRRRRTWAPFAGRLGFFSFFNDRF